MASDNLIDRKALKQYVTKRAAPLQREALLRMMKRVQVQETYSGHEIRRMIRMEIDSYKVFTIKQPRKCATTKSQ